MSKVVLYTKEKGPEGSIFIEFDPKVPPKEYYPLLWPYALCEWDVFGPYKEEVQTILLSLRAIAHAFSDYGLLRFSNCVENLLTPHLKSFTNQEMVQDGVCVLLGSGPSLKKNLDFLKIHKDRFVVFACNSNIDLVANEADIVCAVDPAFTYEHKQAFHQPLMFQGHLDPQLLPYAQGEKILCNASQSFLLEKRLLGEEKDYGWTVFTFMVEVAYSLGFRKMLCIGHDLSSHQGPEGVDYEQNPIHTKNDFILAAKWVEDLLKKHSDLELVQIEKEALQIPKVTYVTQEQIEKQFLQELKPKWHIPCKEFDEGGFRQTLRKIYEELLEVQNIIQRCIENEAPNLLEPMLLSNALFEELLLPLWSVWKYPILEKTPIKAVAKLIFYQSVCTAYLQLFESKDCLVTIIKNRQS